MTVVVHTEDGDVELQDGEYEIEWVIDEKWASEHPTLAVAILPGTESK